MRTIGGWILDVFRRQGDEAFCGRVRAAVGELCAHFPVPGCAEAA
jgi:glycine/serine hydroxymethyltransferase